MFAKLWEREKNHKEKKKPKKWKQTLYLFFSNNPIIQQRLRFLSTCCWKTSLRLTFQKIKAKFYKIENLNKKQTKQTKPKKKSWKLFCENAICFQREIF